MSTLTFPGAEVQQPADGSPTPDRANGHAGPAQPDVQNHGADLTNGSIGAVSASTEGQPGAAPDAGPAPDPTIGANGQATAPVPPELAVPGTPPPSIPDWKLRLNKCSLRLLAKAEGTLQPDEAPDSGTGSGQTLPPDTGETMEASRRAAVASGQTSTGEIPGGLASVQAEHQKSTKPSYIKSFDPPPKEQAATGDVPARPDLTLGDPAKFPIASFPDRFRAIAQQLASVYQVPTCVPAMCMLAALSAAVGKSAVVVRAVRDLRTMLNLFVVIVAERGTCKSVVGGKAVAPIEAFSESLVLDHRTKVASKKTELAVLKKEALRMETKIGTFEGTARDDLIAKLTQRNQRIAELEENAGRKVTAIESDITGEALVRSLEDNHETIFSYSVEAGAVVSVTAGKYKDGKADLDPYLCGYSGDPLRATRVDRGSVVVHQPCLTLLWLMQGIVALDLLDNRDTMPRGFTARALFFDSGARREYDNRRDESFTLAGEWHQILGFQLIRRSLNSPEPKEIACSPEAREVFAKFDDEGVTLERNWCPDLRGELSRQRENAIKVAGLFALLEKQDVISEQMATCAVEVVRWVGLNYLSLVQIQRKDRLKKEFTRIMEILEECGGSVGLGPLAQHHGIKRERVEALIAVFPGDLEIRKVPRPEGQPGRPAELLVAPSIETKAGANKIEILEKLRGRGTAA